MEGNYIDWRWCFKLNRGIRIDFLDWEIGCSLRATSLSVSLGPVWFCVQWIIRSISI